MGWIVHQRQCLARPCKGLRAGMFSAFMHMAGKPRLHYVENDCMVYVKQTLPG